MYSKNRSSETKNGLFYKQGAPHTDSLAAPAYQCSVQYFTFGQYVQGSIHPYSSASNQTKKYASTTNPRALKFDWSGKLEDVWRQNLSMHLSLRSR